MTHILNREKKIADDLIISELLTQDQGRAGWGWLVLVSVDTEQISISRWTEDWRPCIATNNRSC